MILVVERLIVIVVVFEESYIVVPYKLWIVLESSSSENPINLPLTVLLYTKSSFFIVKLSVFLSKYNLL